MIPKEVLVSRMRARAIKIKTECAQLIQDCESWSDNHPDCPRIDPDHDGMLTRANAFADGILTQLAEREPN